MAQRVLILTDGKAGHENQSRALCEALNWDYDRLRVAYPPAHKPLSYVFDWLGCHPSFLFQTEWIERAEGEAQESGYRAVVGAGSTTYYPLKCMARRLACASVAILTPRGYRYGFDCVVSPEYDNPPKRDTVVTVPVNLCAVDPERYRAEAAAFAARHRQQGPAVGFVVGGDSATCSLDAAQLRAQIEQARALLPGCEFWVTTSRRTPPEVDALVDELAFDYRLIYRRTPEVNPTPAFIALCDRLFVTADSASMISETVCFGHAAVEILPVRQKRANRKFARLIDGLQERGCAHLFDGELAEARTKIDLGEHLHTVRSCI